MKKKISKKHKITRNDAIEFMKKEFQVKLTNEEQVKK